MDTVVNYPNPYYRGPDEIEYVRGNFYRTSEGGKVELVWIDPRCGQMLFVRPDSRKTFWVNNGNEYIVGPWREPAQVRVGLYRHQTTGQVRVWDEIGMSGTYAADTWELIETWTLTEGTGNP
jgi:hypothetical protein